MQRDSLDRPADRSGRSGAGADVGELVARAAGDVDRHRALGALARGLAASARRAGVRAVALGHWLADVLAEAAPRIPVRDRATLRAHHPGQTDEEVAEALVRHAALATAALGAAVGALTSAEFVAPPALLAVPAQLAAQTLAVAAVEVKLVAELRPAAPSRRTRCPARG